MADDDTPLNRAYVIHKYMLWDLFKGAGYSLDVYNKTLSPSSILKKYKKLIPSRSPNLERGESLQKFNVCAYRIFADVALQIHKKYVALIKKTFKIDVGKHLHGHVIVNRVGMASAFGTLFFVYGPRDFKISSGSKDKFMNRSILKIQNNKKSGIALEYETYIQRRFYKHGIAPKVLYESHIKKGRVVTSVVVMQKYSRNTLGHVLAGSELTAKELDNVFKGIASLLDKMCKAKLVHGDMHWGNIGLEETSGRDLYKYKLLDFGQSAPASCDRKLELLQMLRTINMFEFKGHNASYLEKKLRDYYARKYGAIATSYDHLHRKVWDAYMHKEHDPKEDRFMRSFRKYSRA